MFAYRASVGNAGNADVYQDGNVDVFDLGLMKRMLL